MMNLFCSLLHCFCVFQQHLKFQKHKISRSDADFQIKVRLRASLRGEDTLAEEVGVFDLCVFFLGKHFSYLLSRNLKKGE